ncbi:MAG TPA: RsbRD N-terminal domain-containing protein [Pyrinomonadaceae bacterium]|nr:RsbRD N-terminal domain-containing protein [Pyrinomonadaceae bacterium]
MPRRFSTLFRQNLDPFTHAWVDEVYADRRTDLSTLLSFRELIEHVPECLDELAFLLDERADEREVLEAARCLRTYAQSRFQRGVLIDEVARELMLLHDALSEFLWQEAPGVVGGDTRELHDALRRTRLFFDEMIAQAILVYAASLRPVVPTRGSVWPPGRRRKR